MHLDRVAVRRALEIFRGVRQVDEGVEALVHPWIKPLVRADNHREPLVPEFVRDHPLLVLADGTVGRESHHRVLHSLDGTFDSGGVRPWIAIPLLAEVLDRLPSHAIHFAPLVRCGPIEILDEDAVVSAGIPTEVGSGGEREIAHVDGGEVPGERWHRIEWRERSLRKGARPRAIHVADFVRADDCDRCLRSSRRREASALSGREHLLRICELSGGGDDVRRRHCERDIEVAVFEIKLPRADVRLVVPAVDVVVNAEPRVPLRHLVERAIVPHASPALRRHVEVPRALYVQRRSGSERRRQIDPHRGSVNRMLRIDSGDAKRLEVSSAVESLTGEVETAAEEDEWGLVQLVGDAVRGAEILLDEEPEIRERVGRVVDVVDRLAAAELVASGVEGGGDFVVDALLPILRARSAASSANVVRRGKIELPEWRRVGDLGERCLGLGGLSKSGDKKCYEEKYPPMVGYNGRRVLCAHANTGRWSQASICLLYTSPSPRD